MPSPDEELATQHAALQTEWVSALLAEVSDLWPQLDTRRLQVSLPQWMAAVLALLQEYAAGSATMAVDYYTAARQDADVRTVFLLRPQAGVDEDRAREALHWATRRLWSRDNDPEAVRPLVERVAQREVLDAGRNTIHQAVYDDPSAVGYVRTAGLNACGFCAMLASRGPVYGEDTVGFRAHDGCNCGQLVVFRGQSWQPNEKFNRWRTLYRQLADQGLKGNQLIHAMDAHQRPDRDR